MPILPNFFEPPGTDIWEDVVGLLEATEPRSSIHDAVHQILEDLNLGNTGAEVTPAGTDIREAVTAALETTEPSQAPGLFIHDAFHEILDDLNLGTFGSLIHDAVYEIVEVNPGAGVTPPGADIRAAVTVALETGEPGQGLGSFIHDAFHEILDDLNLGTFGSFIHDAVHEIFLDPLGQGLSEFIHDFRSDWHLT
jgi:hypothetical protein